MDRINRLTVGELATRTQTTPRALRLYEQVGLIQPQRDTNGYRLYTEQDIDQVLFIKGMRSVGASLKELVELYQIKQSGLPEPEKHRQMLAMIERGQDRLRVQRDAIDAALAELDEYRRQVLGKLSATEETHDCAGGPGAFRSVSDAEKCE